jgi:hypothetical protein
MLSDEKMGLSLMNMLVLLLSIDFAHISYIAQSQSQSYFTTGGLLSISSSWRQAPWDSQPAFFPHWTPAFIALTDVLFTIAAGPHQRSHSQVRAQRDWSLQLVASNCLPHIAVNLVSLITPRPGPHRKHSSSIVVPFIFMGTYLPAKASPSNGRVYLLIKNLLLSSECFFIACLKAAA